jgi:hypothetical protein
VIRWFILAAVVSFAIWGLCGLAARSGRLAEPWESVVGVATVVLTAFFIASWYEVIRAAWTGEPIIKPRPGEPRREMLARDFSLALWTLAWGLSLFALLAVYLVEDKLIRIASADGEPLDDYTAMSKAFLWQLLEVIPLAGVKKALAWDDPGPERNIAGGLVVLGFVLIALIPMIAWITGAFARRKPTSDSRPAVRR